jgi:1-phosphatidylinositol-4-phosphate 5-kinase
MRWRGKKNDNDGEMKSYVKGKVIDGKHELYTLSIAVMIGVRTSISKTNSLLQAESIVDSTKTSPARKSRKFRSDGKGDAEEIPKASNRKRLMSNGSHANSTVQEEKIKERRWVLPSDFRMMEKYEFRPRGGKKTPPHQLAHTFKFKDYAPIAFAYLRRLAGINDYDFLLSICGNANFIEFISNAKSGQFFFYSSDGKYMVKTMTHAESKFLRQSEYFLYF